MQSNEAMKELNRLVGQFMGQVSRQPKYQYWTDKKGSMYFYTTEKSKCKHGDDCHYIAGVYRHNKSKGEYNLKKKRCFSKKWRAMDYAYKLLCKAKKQPVSPYSRQGFKKLVEENKNKPIGIRPDVVDLDQPEGVETNARC